MPSEYLQPCPQSLPLATGDDVHSLIRNHVAEVTPVYRECRDVHGSLIEAVQARARKEAERTQRAVDALARGIDGK